ncbi:glycine betaine ABC transporter substrate-binding protein [Streptomonospora wellingtoniae]|uniref:Glycine betaine ABC transporter substrate-binding protein n=1 Tax=Streptomonospora wellingtoniae TaxID=3075544 RepID=A0ABU2KYJ7_9ACTN|nr:glycine betaine ABC transporter substrate-binding protein [Streptomonospora sp. DSM 45055]MDT0304286.1 glycine betaine ABC transporter substrate-binding protein [Streptomonospora sp. DSM 45055]
MSETTRFTKLIGVGAAAASLALVASACGGGGEGGVSTGPSEGEGGGGDKTITIGLIPWEEDIAVTHLWKAVLEEKGYTVELKNVDVAPVFQGTADGDIDLFMDTWLPNTHGDYMDKYGDKVEDLGAWNENAKLTLTVPSYMEDVNSIEDLKGNADQFNGEIIGIESGSGLVQTTEEEAMPTYGLEDEYKLVKSSTPAMLEELRTATEEEEPIVVTLWRPHLIYAEQDLKDLEDPEGAMGEAETMNVIARKGFSEDHPDVSKWLSDFQLSDEQIGTLEETVIAEHEGEETEGAKAWLADNPDYLKEIMGDDAKDLDFS